MNVAQSVGSNSPNRKVWFQRSVSLQEPVSYSRDSITNGNRSPGVNSYMLLPAEELESTFAILHEAVQIKIRVAPVSGKDFLVWEERCGGIYRAAMRVGRVPYRRACSREGEVNYVARRQPYLIVSRMRVAAGL